MEPESINDYILSHSQDEVLKYKTVDCELYTRSDEYNLSLHKSALEEKSPKFLWYLEDGTYTLNESEITISEKKFTGEASTGNLYKDEKLVGYINSKKEVISLLEPTLEILLVKKMEESPKQKGGDVAKELFYQLTNTQDDYQLSQKDNQLINKIVKSIKKKKLKKKQVGGDELNKLKEKFQGELQGKLKLECGEYILDEPININVNGTLTIDGNNSILDGCQSGNIFNILGSGKVVLKNLTFINALMVIKSIVSLYLFWKMVLFLQWDIGSISGVFINNSAAQRCYFCNGDIGSISGYLIIIQLRKGYFVKKNII